MRVLMIIPAYNEAENILNTINTLINTNKEVDYIIINDGSTDNTKEICERNKLNYINLSSNLGIGGAVQTGFLYALKNDYDIAIQFDGDGQHNPKYINELVNKINDGYDLVIGSRFIDNLSKYKSTYMRRFGINILSKLIKICVGKNIYDPTSGFRAANKKIIKIFANNYPIDYPEPDTIVKIIKLGYNVGEIPVEMKEREFGKSSISSINSIYYMIKVGFSIIMSVINTKKVK